MITPTTGTLLCPSVAAGGDTEICLVCTLEAFGKSGQLETITPHLVSTEFGKYETLDY